MQIKGEGISKDIYDKLEDDEKKLLEEKNGKYWLKENIRKAIKVVAVGGVFDTIHLGHVKFLEDAKREGDVLVVFVARDEHIRKKGRKPLHTLKERVELIGSVKAVDAAIAGRENPQDTIGIVKPDVVIFGYDQKPFHIEGAVIKRSRVAFNPERLKSSKLINNKSGELDD